MPDNPEVLEILKDLQDRMARLEDAANIHSPAREKLAGAVYQLRRRRNELLGAALFSDHGWDILLELYLAECAGQRLQISALGHESLMPQTTMLRYVNLLVAQGLLVREPDPNDRRRAYLHLSRHAVSMMEELLDCMAVDVRADPKPPVARSNNMGSSKGAGDSIFFAES